MKISRNIQIGDKEYTLWDATPLCVITGNSGNRREVFCLRISSPSGMFTQLVYKSTGKNSGMPGEWFPCRGLHYGDIPKQYVDPDTLGVERARSANEHGRFGHPLYKELNLLLKEDFSKMSSGDFPEVNWRHGSIETAVLICDEGEDLLSLPNCTQPVRNGMRMVRFVNALAESPVVPFKRAEDTDFDMMVDEESMLHVV